MLYKLFNHQHLRIAYSASSGGAPPPPPPPPPPTGSARSLRFPHARFRIIQRWPAGKTVDDDFANAHFDDIDGGTLTSHPNAISVQGYSLLAKIEIDGTSYDPVLGYYPTGSEDLGDAYAAAHGDNVEDYWLHALSGSANYQMSINSISALGVIGLKDLGHGGAKSYPYRPGNILNIRGTSVGQGFYTCSSVQSGGVTISGWSGGALGAAGTIQINGDGTQTRANRKTTFFWSEWRNIPNLSAANARAWNISKAVSFVGSTRNGILYDELDSSNITQCAVYLSTEYSSSAGSISAPGPGQNAFVTDICTTLQGMLSASGGPTYLRPNTAGYTFANDIKIAHAGRGIHNETTLNLWSSVYQMSLQLDYTIARVNDGVDVEFSNGDTWTITNGTGSLDGAPSPGGNYPTKTARGAMGLYCYYLLAVDAAFTASNGSIQKHCIVDFTNGYNDNPATTPLSAVWQKGWEFDIGQPFARYSSSLEHDQSGAAQYCCSRGFSHDGGTTLSSWVVLNGNVNGQTNFGTSSLMTNTIPAAPSGKSWYMLMADGTFSTSSFVGSVQTLRAEGVILVAL